MKLHLGIFIFTMITISFASAAELTVIRTEPGTNAQNVSSELREIKIHFSAPVKMNSWSFVTTELGEFPETTGDPSFPNNTLCVLPVKLQPKTTYSLSINSKTKKGFKSAEDEKVSCTPYILTFTTAAKEAATEKPSTAQKAKDADKGEEKKASSPLKEKPLQTIIFEKYTDKTENAFTVLIPKGWSTEGGIIRVNPLAAGGAAQSVEAKFGFAAKKDAAGTVSILWLPLIYYTDNRYMPAGGMFPPGSNYNGMTVIPYPTPQEFLIQLVFPQLHVSASEVRIVDQKSLPKLAAIFQNLFNEYAVPYLPIRLDFRYEAGMVSFQYREGGVQYRETSIVVLENRGQMTAGQWCNKFTVVVRAPEKEFESWTPVFKIIADSGQINPQWVAGELQGQIQRGEIVIRTQEEIQKIEQAMVENRQKTNAEINNDMYLTLTSQEEYINPFTQKVEIGSNEWNYRWQNESGNIIYTDDMNYDPNRDPSLQVQGYKKSAVRPR